MLLRSWVFVVVLLASAGLAREARAQVQLVFSSITVTECVEGGAPGTITVVISNIGDADIPAGQYVMLDGFDENPGSIPPGTSLTMQRTYAYPLGACNGVSVIDAGATCASQVGISLYVGDFFGGATLHDDALLTYVIIKAWPDMTGAIVSAPAQVAVGQPFLVQATVSNIGYGTLQSPFLDTLRIVGQGSASPVWFSAALPRTLGGGGFPVGLTETVTATVVAPLGTVPGSYVLGIEVGLAADIQTLLVDHDYANNRNYAGPTVMVVVAGAVDAGVVADAGVHADAAEMVHADAAEMVHADAAEPVADASEPAAADAAAPVHDDAAAPMADASESPADAGVHADAAPVDAAPAPVDAAPAPVDSGLPADGGPRPDGGVSTGGDAAPAEGQGCTAAGSVPDGALVLVLIALVMVRRRDGAAS